MKHLIPWKKRHEDMIPFPMKVDDLFENFFSKSRFPLRDFFAEESWYPTVNVSEGRKHVIVKAELPGVDTNDIDVSLDGRILTIKGEKREERDETDEHYHRLESAYGYYQRTIELPAEVDASKVDAKYKNGVLKIKLRKAREAESKTIKIKTA